MERCAIAAFRLLRALAVDQQRLCISTANVRLPNYIAAGDEHFVCDRPPVHCRSQGDCGWHRPEFDLHGDGNLKPRFVRHSSYHVATPHRRPKQQHTSRVRVLT